VIYTLHLRAINASLLTILMLIAGPATADDWRQVVDVSDDDVLNIRQAPHFRAAKVGELAHDTNCVELHGCSEGWCRVAIDTGYGWVRETFLAPAAATCARTEPATSAAVAATQSTAADLLLGATELLCNSYLLLSPDPVVAFVESANLLFDDYQSIYHAADHTGMPTVSIHANTAHGIFYADYFGAHDTALTQGLTQGIRCSGSLLSHDPAQHQQLQTLMRHPAAAERLSKIASKTLAVEQARQQDARYFGTDCNNISVKTAQLRLDNGTLMTTLTYALSGSLPPPLTGCTP